MLQCFWQRERNKYETKSIRLRLQTLISFIFLLLFYKKHGFIEEDKPSENVVIVEEELNRFDIDGIENLENLPRFVFINKECGNLKVVNDDEELTRNINQKKKLDVSQIACWCSLCEKCKWKYLFDNHVAIILWTSQVRVIFLVDQ